MAAIHAAHVWDALAEIAVAMRIGEYLLENPPPAGSLCAGDFEDWAFNLIADGTARLAQLDETELF